MRPLLNEQISDYKLNRQVHLLGQRNDVPKLIGDFDIFAFATHLEASGTAFAEAAMAGKPSVGYTTTGVPEMVCNGKTGLLVPLGDIKELTAAINKLASNAELRTRMGKSGFEFAVNENRFTLIGMQNKTENYYLEWLEQRLTK